MAEMDVKFRVTGLYDRLDGRIHSARDMKKPKPDPDVYLYAASLEGVTPAECVVLEDSDTGARAALAAGMTCVLLRPAQESAPYEDNLIRIETLKEFQPILENALFSQKLKTP
ncbi:phosphatase [Acetobacter nitrogenifigens DSM 23921 = NBRC 105050]|nr:phosphatase [Acetobacter nitrogenifigens DSM 23921 = NBRC 105050]